MAELVLCRCKQCRGTIGKFINLWYEIGMYVVPIIESKNSLDVCHKRSAVYGEPGTLMENCRLQIIACVSCSAFLGLKCVETPGNHVLERYHVLFYQGSIVPFDDAGKKSSIYIDRVLDNTEPSSSVSTVSSAETLGESGTSPRAGISTMPYRRTSFPDKRATK
ncbi:hypothetical protein GE21DRAFT_1096839 [Neurospora crassa]|nr:hypothetical protein GE21DRAFT_1096839 [Neurospora crassa]